MAGQGSGNGDPLEQMSGNTGIDAGGDPGDQAFVMNRKISRLAGSPTALVDRDFQRLQRQTPRTPLQNMPTPSKPSVSGILMAAARSRGRKAKFGR